MSAGKHQRRHRRKDGPIEFAVTDVDGELALLEAFVGRLNEPAFSTGGELALVGIGSARQASHMLEQLLAGQYAALDDQPAVAGERIARLLAVQDDLQEALARPNTLVASLKSRTTAGGRVVAYRPHAALIEHQPPPSSCVVAPTLDGGPEQCLICFDEHDSDNMRSLLACGQHRYCAQCIRLHFTTLIGGGQVRPSELTCPYPACSASPAEYELDNLVDADVYDKYLQFVALALLKDERNTRWCLNPDCRQPISWHPSETVVVCPACRTEFCFHCSRHLHPGNTCDGVPIPDAEKAFQAWRAEMGVLAKQCPNCHNLIEKNEGCNHISCRCGHQFCWLCLTKYEYGHFGANSPCEGFQFAAANTREEAVAKRDEERARQAAAQAAASAPAATSSATQERQIVIRLRRPVEQRPPETSTAVEPTSRTATVVRLRRPVEAEPSSRTKSNRATHRQAETSTTSSRTTEAEPSSRATSSHATSSRTTSSRTTEAEPNSRTTSSRTTSSRTTRQPAETSTTSSRTTEAELNSRTTSSRTTSSRATRQPAETSTTSSRTTEAEPSSQQSSRSRRPRRRSAVSEQ